MKRRPPRPPQMAVVLVVLLVMQPFPFTSVPCRLSYHAWGFGDDPLRLRLRPVLSDEFTNLVGANKIGLA